MCIAETGTFMAPPELSAEDRLDLVRRDWRELSKALKQGRGQRVAMLLGYYCASEHDAEVIERTLARTLIRIPSQGVA